MLNTSHLGPDGSTTYTHSIADVVTAIAACEHAPVIVSWDADTTVRVAVPCAADLADLAANHDPFVMMPHVPACEIVDWLGGWSPGMLAE